MVKSNAEWLDKLLRKVQAKRIRLGIQTLQQDFSTLGEKEIQIAKMSQKSNRSVL